MGRHWLIHGVGFTVRDPEGRRLGVVADVLVDPLRNRAERVLVRRPGLFRRPGHITIEARTIESVLPGARLFLVASTAEAAAPAAPPPTKRAVRIGASAQARGRELARGARPLAGTLDRRLAAVVAVALQFSGRAASAGAAATVRAGGWARRESPRLAAWLRAGAQATGRVVLTLIRVLARAGLGGARMLADLAVLVAVAAVAAWRGAAARAQQARIPLDQDPTEPDAVTTQWRSDVDAPLARDTRSGASMRPTGRRRPDEARSERSSRRR